MIWLLAESNLTSWAALITAVGGIFLGVLSILKPKPSPPSRRRRTPPNGNGAAAGYMKLVDDQRAEIVRLQAENIRCQSEVDRKDREIATLIEEKWHLQVELERRRK